MRFEIDGLTVYFPYEYIYKEQYDYMCELKRALDAKGHGVLEMPSGTGKTITLLSFITSYQLAHPEIGKLVYCTRTVPEMEKVLEELRDLIAFRAKEGVDNTKFLAVGLSARKNLCIHPRVNVEYDGASVDAKCRSLTASWVRAAAGASSSSDAGSNPDEGFDLPAASALAAQGGSVRRDDIELCGFFESFEKSGTTAILPPGVYTLADMKKMGQQCGWCPYYLARHMISMANVVVYNYQYMLDPKISNLVSGKLPKECIVVFDEAHNIDNVCIEALSVNINTSTLNQAVGNVAKLSRRIDEMKTKDAKRLNDEYNRLREGLLNSGLYNRGGAGGAAAAAGPTATSTDDVLGTPVLPDHVLREAVPGGIRKAEAFIVFLKRLIEHLKGRLKATRVVSEQTPTFLADLKAATMIEPKPLQFCSDRLVSLMSTLEIADVHEFSPLRVVADFATLVGTYSQGFVIIVEPYDEQNPGVPDPVLQFSCLDASLAMKPVFEKYQSVIITSGTLSPLDFYPRILGFSPVLARSFEMTLTRQCICPLVVTRGNDQVAISSKFALRSDQAVIRNYGELLLDLVTSIPDGIICFFVSYAYMEDVVSTWHSMGLLDQISKHKLIFIETPHTAETTLALANYRRACDAGRGAVFLSIARGKIAEGVDFDGHYGRAVVMMGIPYVYTESRILKARLEYLSTNFQIRDSEFLTFDAIRNASQCIGRVIRNKTDYGLMILADQRYNRIDKRSKLPQWIQQFIKDAYLNLSTDMAMSIARSFMREMAQPFQRDAQFGTSLLTQSDVDRLAAQRFGRDAPKPLPLLLAAPTPSASASASSSSSAPSMSSEKAPAMQQAPAPAAPSVALSMGPWPSRSAAMDDS